MTRKEIKQQLITESHLMYKTAVAMAETMFQRKTLRKKWKQAKASSGIIPLATWKEFMKSSLSFGHDLHRATTTVSRIKKLLSLLKVKPQRLVAMPDEPNAVLRDVLSKAKFKAGEIDNLIGRVTIPSRGVSFAYIAKLLTESDKGHSDVMDRKLKRVVTSKNADETIGRATGYLDPEDPGYEEDFKCFVTVQGVRIPEEIPKEICIFVLIVVLFYFLAKWIGGAIADAIKEAETDEGPRAIFNSQPCSALDSMPTDELIIMLEHLSRGPTLDGDEQAILRLFGCLSCSHLTVIWNSDSILDRSEGTIGSRMLYDFDGDEFDRLKVRLQECGIMRFSDFDDDATRIFINSNNCTVLSRLSKVDIRQLLLNLFSGSTGDDDEAAIIKLIECLPLTIVRELMAMPNLSYDDFDDVVDGAEWTRLRRTLEAARVAWA